MEIVQRESVQVHISETLKEMREVAVQMHSIISKISPEDLIGYIHFKLACINEDGNANSQQEMASELQFLLEYVHAVLASTQSIEVDELDQKQYSDLFKLSCQLRYLSMTYAALSSINASDSCFGKNRADIEFITKSTWVTLRGHRYQVLEKEFYHYVLTPHNKILKEVYGVGAVEIAEGIQAISSSIHSGLSEALKFINERFGVLRAESKSFKELLKDVLKSSNLEQKKQIDLFINDIFKGGIANLSLHTKLPESFLADLAYTRGEDKDFYADGIFSGTPYKTLPIRTKPLIKLDSGYYAVDTCFFRDSGYRALLYNLLQRKPTYKKEFEKRQKEMSERAFVDVLKELFSGASVFHEIYYKDPQNNKWCENDTLVLVDDVLFLIEAKSGAAATIASPAIDFDRHLQSVQDLVLKAYDQCHRFFSYIYSQEEVPLYHFVNGKYEECIRIRHSEFRMMIPIGLTVESFSPFSTFCKELPQIKPLLGKHNFISISIDDLFVLKRFLTKLGAFVHYMSIRQKVAGIRHALLFDEFDHLGAYVLRNRFDLDLIEEVKENNANLVLWDGMSDVIDKNFVGNNWQTQQITKQYIPEEMQLLLDAVELTHSPKWLYIDNYLRDFDVEARDCLSRLLASYRESIKFRHTRYFTISGKAEPLFIWMQSCNSEFDWQSMQEQASAIALSINSQKMICLAIRVNSSSEYVEAIPFFTKTPRIETADNDHIFKAAKRIMERGQIISMQKET